MGRKKLPAIHACRCRDCQKSPDANKGFDNRAGLHCAINRLVAVTDERSRRLFVGYLAQLYKGGYAYMARVTGLSPHTIRRGWRELKHPDFVLSDQVRRPGGGRKHKST
jgi:hypothetical protein